VEKHVEMLKGVCYVLCMKVGYGFNRDPDDLRAAGAERVHIDTDRRRPERVALYDGARVRPGDVVIVLALNDLGGTDKASEAQRARLEAIGATVKIAEGFAPQTPGHRPSSFTKASADRISKCRAAWLHPGETEATKIAKVQTIMGWGDLEASKVRGRCYYRFGTVENPKPERRDGDGGI
jgi:hypothetical protein